MPAGAEPERLRSDAERVVQSDADRVGRRTYDVETFAPGHRPPTGTVILVGGVSELYQSDLDLGRRVVEQLDLAAPGTYVEDLSYGAIPFVHRLQELEPDVLVLLGAVQRDREPGTVRRRVVTEVDRTPEQLQQSVGDAYVGYVDLDLATDVAQAMQVLPPRTVVVEAEPAVTGPGPELSPVGAAMLDPLTRAVEREVAVAPLFELTAVVRASIEELDAGTVVDELGALVDALDAVDAGGTLGPDAPWGPVYAARDEVRRAVASAGGPALRHAEWGMLWSLDEALGRLRPLLLTPDGH